MIGTIISFWYIGLFVSIWTIVSLYRPVLVVTLVLVLRKPKAALYKLRLFANTILFLTLSNDKKWDKRKVPKQCPTLFFPGSSTSTNTNTNTTSSSSHHVDDNNNNNNNNNVKKNIDESVENSNSTTRSTENTSSSSTGSSSGSTNTTGTSGTGAGTANNSNRDSIITRKTIIFVRHGESTWNDTFNKGDRKLIPFLLGFIPNLIYSIGIEYYFWITGQETESWFYDSPLSEKGIQQALGIQKYLQTDSKYLLPKEAKMLAIMKGESENVINNDNESKAVLDSKKTIASTDPSSTSSTSSSSQSCTRKKSQLVASNLRRAIATMAIGFQDRINDITTGTSSTDDDTILVIPALQEISRNPDALSITPPFASVVPSWTDPYHIIQSIYNNNSNINNNENENEVNNRKSKIDTRLHTGNKPLYGTGYERIQEFCSIVFHKLDNNTESIIACGHSLWFREFFKLYLPHNFDHVAKRKKLINGGIVGFTLEQIEIMNTNNNNDNDNATGSNIGRSTHDGSNIGRSTHEVGTPTSTKTKNPQNNDTNSNALDPAIETRCGGTATKVSYHYMIDPTSIVVLHGGF